MPLIGLRLFLHRNNEREASLVTETWERHEQTVAADNRRREALARLEEERNPSRRCMHRFFRMISLVTGICGLLMGAGQIVGMTFENLDIIAYVMRGYVIVLCLLIVLNEAEWTSMIKNSSILRYWITRGLFYSFVGVVGIQQNDHVVETDRGQGGGDSPSLKFIKVVALLMVGCGCLYFVMGAMCLQIYYNRLRRDYEERVSRAVHIRSATDRLAESIPDV